MSTGTWIAQSRGVWDHPLFEGERFSRRDAWGWLCAHAAWQPREVVVRATAIVIGRGQLIGARSFLARKWGWGEQEVRTFLKLLISQGMIEVNQEPTTRASVITVCNYDKYQPRAEFANQQSNQQLTSNQPATNQSINKETNKQSLETRAQVDEREPSKTLPMPSFATDHSMVSAVELVDDTIVLRNGTRELWLRQFDGNETDLDLALIKVRGSIQPNSRAHDLKTQVERHLAAIVMDRRDRDRRYNGAVERNRPAATSPASKAHPTWVRI